MGLLSHSLQEIVDQLMPSSEEQTRQANALQQVATCPSRIAVARVTPNVELCVYSYTAMCSVPMQLCDQQCIFPSVMTRYMRLSAGIQNSPKHNLMLQK